MTIDYFENGEIIQIEEDDPRNPANITGAASTISDERILELKEECERSNRNELLVSTDWWGVSDRTMSDAEKKYRQDLRDLPTHSNWPNLEDSDWPTKPS